MRRMSILPIVIALLVSAAVTAPAEAQEGTPGDHCSFSPDRPLGWRFSPACARHDACIDGLPAGVTLDERLRCDEEFRVDLHLATREGTASVCRENIACRFIAEIYYVVVRFLTVQGYARSG